EVYRQRADPLALARMDDIRQSGDLAAAARLADDYLATSAGDDALLLVADLAIERGWMWRAIEALRRIDPRWQATGGGASAEEVGALGWELVLPRLSDEQVMPLAEAIADRSTSVGGWVL